MEQVERGVVEEIRPVGGTLLLIMMGRENAPHMGHIFSKFESSSLLLRKWGWGSNETPVLH